MECRFPWRWHSIGGGVWHHLPDLVLPRRQQLGAHRCYPLPLWYAGQLYGLHRLPLGETPFEMERAIAQVGENIELVPSDGKNYAIVSSRADEAAIGDCVVVFLIQSECPTEVDDIVLSGQIRQKAR